MDILKIAATARGLNYLPEYYAAAKGIFDDQDLKVENEPKDPWTGVLDDLETGAADIALGGLWVPAMLAGTKRDVVVVGQLNARFPMAIVTREPVQDFTLDWLREKTVLVPGVGGTAPYEFTAGLIREAGLNPANTRFVRDLSTDLLRELFEGGLGDAMVADLTTATTLQHAGFGTMSYQIADLGGVMPNSVYYIRRDRLEELREPLVRFMRSIRLAMSELVATTADSVLPLATELWPDVAPAVLESATARLIGNQTWEGVRIDRAASDRWTAILYEAGLTTSLVRYDQLVDVAVVDAAERQTER